MPQQILPRDGFAEYYGPILAVPEADAFLLALMQEIDWQHDRVKLYGKEIVTRREVAGTVTEPFQYTYSQNTKTALPWTPSLSALKAASGRHQWPKL